MDSNKKKRQQHQRRKRRIRKSVIGLGERPRLTVFRSNKNIYAQIIDDWDGKTICSASSRDKSLRDSVTRGSNMEGAKQVGTALAKTALEKGVSQVVFDRNGFKYHGRIKALAETAREAGLKF